ncbi:hypothetical protein BGZ88_008590 [Linnemannia elongata]|nr:hypothetical protein BGZ88_008590 [Linnemannia elongata]
MAVQAMLGPGGLNDQPPENESLYPNDDEVEEDTEPKVAKLTTLKKLRMDIIKIRSSPQRIQKFFRICDIVKCPKLALIRDVRTRWNSKFAMLDRAIDLKDAYQSICQNELTHAAYTLEEGEWSYLERLRVLLSQFVTMTKTVSSSRLDYHSKTDSTPVYAMATVMDPMMRFDWWGANDWGEYIKISKDMVTDIWNHHYKGKEGPIELDVDTER